MKKEKNLILALFSKLFSNIINPLMKKSGYMEVNTTEWSACSNFSILTRFYRYKKTVFELILKNLSKRKQI